MGTSVFLSYCRADRTYVKSLVDYLAASNIDVWWDYELEFGGRWPRELEERIDSCDAFLIVLTPSAVSSKWVQRELARADKANKRILPLLLEPSPTLIELEHAHLEDVRSRAMPSPKFLEQIRTGTTSPVTPSFVPGLKFSELVRPAHGLEIRQVEPPLTGQAGASWMLSFRPDGQLLAMASGDTMMWSWDPTVGRPTGTPLHRSTAPQGATAFSPSGDMLAAAIGKHAIELWDTATGHQVAELPTSGFFPGWSVFSPDGHRIAVVLDEAIHLWDLDSGYPVNQKRLRVRLGAYGLALFSPGGDRLATTADQPAGVELWDPATGERVGGLQHGGPTVVTAAAFSPDGQLLAVATGDRKIRLWDVTTGDLVGRPLIGHNEPAVRLDFSPDARQLATVGRDRTILLWDLAFAQPVARPLTGHVDAIVDLAYTPDGKILATAGDRTVRLWDPVTGRPVREPLIAHTGPVHSASFSLDARLLVTTGRDAAVRLWYLAAE